MDNISNCKIFECSKSVYCRGYCSTHYSRLLQTGVLVSKSPSIRHCKYCETKYGKFAKNRVCYPCYEHLRYDKKFLSKSNTNKKYYKTIKGRYSNAKASAKSRGLIWNLSLEKFTEFLNSPCTYCESPLTEYGSGLDRLNNLFGYESNNVIPCCGFCNKLRGDLLSHEETIEIVRVLKRLRSKNFIWDNFRIKSKLDKRSIE